ncbi:MAG: MFS transporter [Gammaproteobacteria bacterium]|nr:MAG: MFS transporter [Gammaproteobacteria bacterium]
MSETHWIRVWIAFLAGCIGAFQIGKAFASLPLIIAELELNLIQAGLILSLFSLIAAFAGAGFGLLSDRIGHLRTALTGLAISAAGAFLGATAAGVEILLLSRLIEGFGFILAVVTLPSLISASASEKDRPLAMGLWGAFMPAGIGASMVITPPLLEWHGWRGLWNDVGIITLVWGAILLLTFRGTTKAGKLDLGTRDLVANALRLGPLLVVAGFVCYSSLYQSLTAFLPTMLTTEYGMTLARSANLGALVVVANVVGNVSAGWLIGRGAIPWKLLTLSFVAMGLCASLVFSGFTEPAMKTVAGILFSAFGGMFPGTAFVLAARFAIKPSHMALMAGLMLQGAGIGQTIGPMMVSSVVELSGSWNSANVIVAAMALIGLGSALLLRKRS